MTDIDKVASAAEDIALMLRAKNDDLAAYSLLVKKHQQSIMNFFARNGVYRGDDHALAVRVCSFSSYDLTWEFGGLRWLGSKKGGAVLPAPPSPC